MSDISDSTLDQDETVVIANAGSIRFVLEKLTPAQRVEVLYQVGYCFDCGIDNRDGICCCEESVTPKPRVIEGPVCTCSFGGPIAFGQPAFIDSIAIGQPAAIESREDLTDVVASSRGRAGWFERLLDWFH